MTTEQQVPPPPPSGGGGGATVAIKQAAAVVAVAFIAGGGIGVGLGVTAFNSEPETVVETREVEVEVEVPGEVVEIDNPEHLELIAELESELEAMQEEKAPDLPDEEGLFSVDDEVSITRGTEVTANIILTDVEFSDQAQRRYSDPPSNGQWAIVDIDVVGVTSESFNALHFYVVDSEGNRYDRDSSGISDIDDSFSTPRVNAGERSSGKLAFNVPEDEALILHYAPNRSGGPVVSWQL
ncbi:DUF4352 domain-containing protein [Phytoactinopolyspora mesophila]|nr:DUF4352 domain-containing protein [Phytoactinopolyspora mesophila]